MSKERQFNLCSGYPVSGMPVQAHAAQEPVAVSGGPYSSMPMPTFQPVGESSADRAARLASELVIEISTASRVNDTVLADRIETKLTEIHDLLLSIDIKISNTTDPKQFLLDMEEKFDTTIKLVNVQLDNVYSKLDAVKHYWHCTVWALVAGLIVILGVVASK